VSASGTRTGLVYVARVKLRNDFAVGVTSYSTGEFIPYRGYLGGGAIFGHGNVVHDRTRPAISDGWKVGFTTNLRLRIVSLTGKSRGPVDVVALKVGPRACEVETHRSLRACGAMLAPQGPSGFNAYGCSREWYRDSPEFRAWLDRFDASWRGSIAYQAYSGRPVPYEAAETEARLTATTWVML
jgi:hypothetical protein